MEINIPEKLLITATDGDTEESIKNKEQMSKASISTALRLIADKVEKGEFKGIVATSEVGGEGDIISYNVEPQDYVKCAIVLAMGVTNSIENLKKDLKENE